MSLTGRAQLVQDLRRQADAGAHVCELINLVHERLGVPRYNRGVVMAPFRDAFGFGPLDFTNLLFACELFGDGASVSLEETERLFRKRVAR